jgi:hypothetical protein
MQNRLDYAFHPVLGYDLLRIPCVFPPVTRIHTKIGKNDRLLMLHARDACCSGTPGMIMCSVFMELGSLRFRSSWPSSIIMYMHHSLTVQYPIQRCGTAEGTNQHRTTRTSSAFDHTVFSNLISESKLDETLHNINYRNARNPWPLRSSGMYGENIDIGEDPDHTIMVYSP